MLTQITSWSYHHRGVVVVAWVAALVGINLAALSFGGESKQEFLSPGTDSKAAVELLDERFPDRAGDTVTLVIRDSAGVLSPAVRAEAEPTVVQMGSLPHVVATLTPWDAAGRAQISENGKIGYAVLQLDTTGARFPVEVAAEMVELADRARADGLEMELSGQAIENVQSSSMGAEGPGLAIAALVLLIAFGSVVAMGLPLATALAGVGLGLGIGKLLTVLVDVPEWASSVAIMIGLGVGIDYALLILTRYRGELAAGAEPSEAVGTAMATAGRSVVFAGVTVVISLLGMLTMNQPYVPGVAYSAVITVASVLLAALTLLPALMGFAGRGINRLSVPFLRRSAGTQGQGFWFRWSRLIQRRPVLMGLAGAAALGVLVAPVTDLRLGYPDDGNDPTTLTTRRAYDLMTEGFGAGFNGAFVLVADRGDTSALGRLGRLADVLRTTHGVAAVSSPLPAPLGDAAVLSLTPTTSPQSPATKHLLTSLREEVVPEAMSGSDVEVKIGGITAADVDQTNSIAHRLPVFIVAVILLSLLLLVAVFRSVVIAAQAAVFNLLSVLAAYGVISLAAQGGWLGNLVGISTPTPIPAFIPMMMFAILFGLSMDYEVFLLSRVREEYLETQDNSGAVADAVASTGNVITAAALIMTAVFGAFVLDDQIFLKIIGVGMAAAVLIDALVIRLTVAPSVMQLCGERNWWIPGWLDRRLPSLDIEGTAPSQDPTPGSEPAPALQTI